MGKCKCYFLQGEIRNDTKRAELLLNFSHGVAGIKIDINESVHRYIIPRIEFITKM